MNNSYDVVVVGSGPNGLSAAIRAAQANLRVLLLEGRETVGGGMRSEALTLPGFTHDVCSAIHPMAAASPFFSTLPLKRYGLRWVRSPLPAAHPLEERAALLQESVAETAASLGRDAERYRQVMSALEAAAPGLLPDALSPLLRWPSAPVALAGFGALGLLPASGLAGLLRTEAARALLAGLAAHSVLPLHAPGTAAMALMFALVGHTHGWPFPEGGAGRLADALAAHLRALGGEIQTGVPVRSLAQLPPSRAVLLDVSVPRLLDLLGPGLPSGYARQLRRYRHGPGVFKVDYALSGPVPWRDPAVGRAATVHLGGRFEEVARAEAEVARGEHPERPFVLAAQHTPFDPTRAPGGQHTFWAYCHVPPGSTHNMRRQIEAQIERFAPGFRDLVLARHERHAAAHEVYNPNYVGGDVTGGQATLRQLVARPTLQPRPYRTPLPGVYLCSASTPPGGGVHGMCGYHAAQTMLDDLGLG